MVGRSARLEISQLRSRGKSDPRADGRAASFSRTTFTRRRSPRCRDPRCAHCEGLQICDRLGLIAMEGSVATPKARANKSRRRPRRSLTATRPQSLRPRPRRPRQPRRERRAITRKLRRPTEPPQRALLTRLLVHPRLRWRSAGRMAGADGRESRRSIDRPPSRVAGVSSRRCKSHPARRTARRQPRARRVVAVNSG